MKRNKEINKINKNEPIKSIPIGYNNQIDYEDDNYNQLEYQLKYNKNDYNDNINTNEIYLNKKMNRSYSLNNYNNNIPTKRIVLTPSINKNIQRSKSLSKSNIKKDDNLLVKTKDYLFDRKVVSSTNTPLNKPRNNYKFQTPDKNYYYRSNTPEKNYKNNDNFCYISYGVKSLLSIDIDDNEYLHSQLEHEKEIRQLMWNDIQRLRLELDKLINNNEKTLNEELKSIYISLNEEKEVFKIRENLLNNDKKKYGGDTMRALTGFEISTQIDNLIALNQRINVFIIFIS